MRKYDVAYVPNGPMNYYPATPLEDMTLDEIKKKYLKMCGKCNGDVSVCSKCKTPCRQGERAVQLVANEIYNDPPVPLYGGKTLIEKAREENMKRKEAQNIERKKAKDGRVYIEDWYNKAVESGDPVKWVMETYGFSKSKAKQKIYGWLSRHPETVPEPPVDPVLSEPVPQKETEIETVHMVEPSIESKLEELMNEQAACKKQMDEYMRLYNLEKEKYEKIKQKTDTLANALDILNDT